MFKWYSFPSYLLIKECGNALTSRGKSVPVLWITKRQCGMKLSGGSQILGQITYDEDYEVESIGYNAAFNTDWKPVFEQYARGDFELNSGVEAGQLLIFANSEREAAEFAAQMLMMDVDDMDPQHWTKLDHIRSEQIGAAICDADRFR